MAQVSLFLNFKNQTEEAFNFYKKVFKTEFVGDIMRLGDDAPEDAKNLVAYVGLPILGGFILSGADAPESMGFTLSKGSNMYITLEPDTRAEADTLFAALSDGGEVQVELSEQPWGAYYGTFIDKFGVKWMLNCMSKN